MATGMSAFMWIAIMGMGTCIFIARTGMCTGRMGMVTEVTGRITAGMVVTAEAMDMVMARTVTAIEMDRGWKDESSSLVR